MTIHDAETLQNEYIAHSDTLQELMESTGDPDLESTVETQEADISDLKGISQELYHLTTIRSAYMESISIDSKTKYLTDIDVVGTREQTDLEALREHVGKWLL